MLWILMLIWSEDGSMMAAQFGPFADRPACEASVKDLTRNTNFAGTLRASCALSRIDPAKLPAVEISTGKPKASE